MGDGGAGPGAYLGRSCRLPAAGGRGGSGSRSPPRCCSTGPHSPRSRWHTHPRLWGRGDTGERRGTPSQPWPTPRPRPERPQEGTDQQRGTKLPLQTGPTRGGHPTGPSSSKGGPCTWVSPPGQAVCPAALERDFPGRPCRHSSVQEWPCSPVKEPHLRFWVLTRMAHARGFWSHGQCSRETRLPPALRPGGAPHSCPQTCIPAPHTPSPGLPETLRSHSCQQGGTCMRYGGGGERAPLPPSTPTPVLPI